VGALLIGGCSSGPSQVGAAAFVNDTEIPLKQVQSQLTTVLTKEGAQVRDQLAVEHQLDDLARTIVTLQVRHELLAIAARRAGLTVDQARVNRLVSEVGGAEAASQGTVFDANTYRQRVSDKLLMAQLGRRALRNSAVTVDYTTAETRTAAQARVEELSRAGAKRARQLIDADVRAGKDAVIGKRIVAADDPIFATTPAFGVAEGTVVAFQLTDTTPWLIMVIKNRTDRGVQPSDHAPVPGQIDPAVLEAIGLRQLAQVGEEVGVRLAPRYGIWDPVSVQAVANENETSGFLAPLRPAPRA
ncbi:MAG TPA: SurA N-terminal domain-containing protein, partial [Pseudonocardiaceae bacterium]|nr:SurA N-terminal domain-containing protein [Pseudonocardiaceae bacterium]